MSKPSRFTLEDGAVHIKDFDKAPPFTSFLPGLSGVRGIPLWAFYCNRGQGISSLGVHHKGSAMMAFHPAFIAYEKAATEGFRTFIRTKQGFSEPFSPLDRAPRRSMTIKPNAMAIEEINAGMGLAVRVSYCTLPGMPIGALMRGTEIENISDEAQTIEILDGLPRVIPYGMSLSQFKDVGNLFKSWAEVRYAADNAPLYLLRSSTEDSSKVSDVSGAFFLYSVSEGKSLPIIHDPALVFGEESSLMMPYPYRDCGLAHLIHQEQQSVNRIACGFAAARFHLAPGEKRRIDTFAGFTPTADLLASQLPLMKSKGFAQAKSREADDLCDALLDDVDTATGLPLFDAYIRQSYLDNFLRGGYPLIMGDDKVVHLFSRKHGDPERDYNWFAIAGEYYSQGNGNFRDVCQNRRCDVRLHPEVKDYNVWAFYSFVQADGYNPLEIRPAAFRIRDMEAARRLLADSMDHTDAVAAVIEKDFTPGMVSGAIAAHGIAPACPEQELIDGLLRLCELRAQASFVEGYWSDHWDYLLDLTLDYLAVYPEKKRELLFERLDYRFFDSGVLVRPRNETSQLTPKGVRRWDSLDISGETHGTHWLKDKQGDEITTNLLGKLLTLCVNKTALLDPEGMGVSMDGGRPGWNDAMNGLPGLFGSGMAESIELKRMLDFVLDLPAGETKVPAELARLMRELTEALKGDDFFLRWDSANTALETYRAGLHAGFRGEYETLGMDALRPHLTLYRDRVREGIDKALRIGQGIMPTYFCYKATAWEELKDDTGHARLSVSGMPLVRVTSFERETAPFFLEGPARYLATIRDDAAARSAIEKARASELYDPELNMYLTSVKLDNMSIDYGRIRAFTAGWLERESVFLHMAYKYLLGMLKADQPDSFWQAARTGLIPFLDPDTYGRSVLENCSFIASSRNPDPAVRGRGFVSRLSGSTVEMLSIWLEAFLGHEGIREEEDGTLSLRFQPMLPGDLFDENGEAAFRLMSVCRVTYHNPSRKDTWGDAGVRPVSLTYTLDGQTITVPGDTLRGAKALREGCITQIDITLG